MIHKSLHIEKNKYKLMINAILLMTMTKLSESCNNELEMWIR